MRKAAILAVVVGAIAMLVATTGWWRGSAGAQPSAARRPPDLFVIVLDSLRADALDREVDGRPVMPRLAEWSKGVLRFTRARAPSCSTPTSVAALFTSLPVPATGVTFHRALPERAVTLAEVLRGAGYATRAYSANPNVTARLGFDRGFDELVEAYIDPQLSERVRIQPRHPGWIVRPEALIDRAWRDLEQAAAGSPRPQFVYLHLLQPHAPYQPPAPHRDLFLRPDMTPVEASIPEIAAHDGRPLAPEWLAGLRARYDEHVHWADAAAGALLDRIARHPRWREAAIVVLSDHGEAFGEHGRLFHNTTVHEEMLRVPLLLRLPGETPPAGRVDVPVDLLDVAPTLTRLAGAVTPPQFWGRDLSPGAGLAPAGDGEREFLAVARPPAPKFPPFVSLVTGRLKVIRNERTGATALYDLAADPGETRDLSTTHEDLLALATGRLDALLARCRDLDLGLGEQARPLREEIERLRSLGYVQ